MAEQDGQHLQPVAITARGFLVDLRQALPRRTRLRLRLTGYADTAAIWLAGHGYDHAATRLWKLFRLW